MDENCDTMDPRKASIHRESMKRKKGHTVTDKVVGNEMRFLTTKKVQIS